MAESIIKMQAPEEVIMDSLWKDLPKDIVEMVLLFEPLANWVSKFLHGHPNFPNNRKIVYLPERKME